MRESQDIIKKSRNKEENHKVQEKKLLDEKHTETIPLQNVATLTKSHTWNRTILVQIVLKMYK